MVACSRRNHIYSLFDRLILETHPLWFDKFVVNCLAFNYTQHLAFQLTKALMSLQETVVFNAFPVKGYLPILLSKLRVTEK